MKAWILLALAMATFSLAYGQREVPNHDTTVISIIGRDLIIIRNAERDRSVREDRRDDRYTEWDTQYSPSYDSEPAYIEPARVEYPRYTYDPPREKPRRVKNNVQVKVLALDLGFTNYYDHKTGAFGNDVVQSELEVSNARLGSHVAFHFVPTTVRLVGNYAVNLETALTLDFTQYYFTQPYVLVPFQPELTFEPSPVNLRVNKLETRYFQVPLMMSFRTHPDKKKGVGIAVGGYAGARIFAKTKQSGEEYGKVKIKDDFNTNPWRYGLTARLNVAWLELYGCYNMSSLFADGEGPRTPSFMAGVRLCEF